MRCELPPVGTRWRAGFFAMDGGVGELSIYVAGDRKVVRVGRLLFLDDMAG